MDHIPTSFYPLITSEILQKTTLSDADIPEILTRKWLDTLPHACIGSSVRPIYKVVVPETVLLMCGNLVVTNKDVYIAQDELVNVGVYYRLIPGNFAKICQFSACPETCTLAISYNYYDTSHLYGHSSNTHNYSKDSGINGEGQWYDFGSAHSLTAGLNINTLTINMVISNWYTHIIKATGQSCAGDVYYRVTPTYERVTCILELPAFCLLTPVTKQKLLYTTDTERGLITTLLNHKAEVADKHIMHLVAVLRVVLRLSWMLQMYASSCSSGAKVCTLLSSNLILYDASFLHHSINTMDWDSIKFLLENYRQRVDPAQVLLSLCANSQLAQVPWDLLVAWYSLTPNTQCRRAVRNNLTQLGQQHLVAQLDGIVISPSPLRNSWSPQKLEFSF